jgi:DNA-binding beta-propeller fold protein YncE
MARPKLVSPDQPRYLRLILGVVQFLASLKLAVVLILGAAFIFALGTFIEAAYGTPAAAFGVYQTWWFNLWLLLLAINIFSAAAIRYPWKRHQTGFVITHVGLLTLLLGAAMGRIYGIDAQIFVFELGADHRAYADDLKFHLAVHEPGGEKKEVVLDKFKPGVFSWVDYGTMFRLNPPGAGSETWGWKLFRAYCGLVFSIADRTTPGDVLYNRDGVKLEVLDYYADSREVSAPMIELMLSLPSSPRMTADGKTEEGPVRWAPFTFSVTTAPNQKEQYPHGLGARQLAGGGHVAFWLTGSDEQVQAFLNGGPEGTLGEKGQVVLFAGGKKHYFLVDEKLDQGPFPLEGTGLEAELAAYWPQRDIDREKSKNGVIVWTGNPTAEKPEDPGVKISLRRDGREVGEMVLFARAPDDNIQDYKNKVFGDYWFDQSRPPAEGEKAPPMITGGGSRIDVIQSPDEKLYYRYWRRGENRLEFARELPSGGSPETAVAGFTMPVGQQQLYVKEFVPSPAPASDVFLPLAFDREKNIGVRQPAAKVRLTVDGEPKEFWIAAYIGPPEETPRLETQHRTVFGKERFVSLIMPVDSVDIGFRTRLQKFERKLDPGTSQPSHYASTIDILDRDRDRTVYAVGLDASRPIDLKAPTPRGAGDIASAGGIAVDGKRGHLYWIDPRQRTIQRAKLQDGRVGEVVEGLVESGLREPQDLELDIAAGKMYWSDHETRGQEDRGYIYRADLNGSKVEMVAQWSGYPTDLALDPDEQAIYWLDPWKGEIGRVGYDGQNLQASLVAGLDRAGGLAFDAVNKQLYWTEQGEGVIRRAGADGGKEKTIVVRRDYEAPVRIAVDPAEGKIYWSDAGEGPIVHRENGPTVPDRHHKIRRADLDGGNVEDVVKRNVHEPGAVAIDAEEGRLYWAQDAVHRRDVWITMNAPIEFSDPFTHRRFRLFQEAFNGPWRPGDPQFEQNVPSSSQKGELYQSVLTANSDPGRPVRNLGCLLVTLGIATMFYMRAYFFKPRRPAGEPAPRVEEEMPAPPRSRKSKKKKAEPVT